jgi:hypothetical protein
MEELLELLEKIKAEVEAEEHRAEARLEVLETYCHLVDAVFEEAETNEEVSDEDFKKVEAEKQKADESHRRQTHDLATIGRASEALKNAVNELILYMTEWD